MGSFFYFAILLVQVTTSLATEPIPLKCFLQNYNSLNIFDKNPAVAATQDSSACKSFQFDPIKVKFVSFNKHGWVHNASDIDYKGLDDAIVDDFGFNLVTNFAKLTFHTDLELTYDYSSVGSLFSTPINGDGSAKVILKNFQLGLSLPFDTKEVDGKKFIELKGFNSWYQVRDKALFYFDNSFNGNKELSDAMHDHINKKWKFVVEEFGKDFFESFADGVYLNLKNYLLKMPLKNFQTC